MEFQNSNIVGTHSQKFKFCKKCQTEKPITEFNKRSKSPDGLAYRCKKCHHKKFDLPEDKNSYSKEYHKERHVRTKYGITLEEYNNIIEKGCRVCGSFDMPRLDHCHQTGAVRGCLCHKCNTALGLLDDNLEKIMSLYKYLSETSKEE